MNQNDDQNQNMDNSKKIQSIVNELYKQFKTKICTTEDDIISYLKTKIKENFQDKSFCIDVTKTKNDILERYNNESQFLSHDFYENATFKEEFVLPLMDSIFYVNIYK